MYLCIVFGVCVYLDVFLYVFQVYDVEVVCTKKTAFSLHTDQIDITVAFILEIAIEQTFVLKCQRKCHYRNLPYMLAPLPSPHSTSSSLFKLSPLPKQTTFSGFGLCLFARTLAHLSACFGGYFFLWRSVWSTNRAQTELCFRLLQWAGKAEEGIRAWQLRRVGLKTTEFTIFR